MFFFSHKISRQCNTSADQFFKCSAWAHVGHHSRRVSWFCQQICHRGRCMTVCGRGEHGGAVRDGDSTSLPSFRSRNSGETLRAAIIHYMATSARLQWWGWLFRYAIGRMTKLCLKGSSTPAYKGAWRGQHDGSGADTTWSPRLSPMRVYKATRHGLVCGSAISSCVQYHHGLSSNWAAR
jgi:hypothetical protein